MLSQVRWFQNIRNRQGFRLRWWQGREWYCQLLLIKLFVSDRLEIWNHKWDCQLTRLFLQMQYYKGKLSVTFSTSGYQQIKQVTSIAVDTDAVLFLSHIFYALSVKNIIIPFTVTRGGSTRHQRMVSHSPCSQRSGHSWLEEPMSFSDVHHWCSALMAQRDVTGFCLGCP